MLHYIQNPAPSHRMYFMMGRYRYEDLHHFLSGMPPYFYLLFLAIKTPLPILAAFLAGLAVFIRRRREPGPSFILFMFLLWIVPYSILSAKWLRYMLSCMPAVTIIAATGLVKGFSLLSALRKQHPHRAFAWAGHSVLAVVFFAVPLWTAIKAAPFYSLYQNSLAGQPAGYYFPHDELNDAGLDLAIKQICAQAPHRAIVGGESQTVAKLFNYYFHRYGRDDLRYVQIKNDMTISKASDPYLVISNARRYEDNAALIRELELNPRPGWIVKVAGVTATEVFHPQELAQLRSSP